MNTATYTQALSAKYLNHDKPWVTEKRRISLSLALLRSASATHLSSAFMYATISSTYLSKPAAK